MQGTQSSVARPAGPSGDAVVTARPRCAGLAAAGALAALLVGAAGCGQKGPLTLPAAKPAAGAASAVPR
jgi:predicted small lipoprotein YifL